MSDEPNEPKKRTRKATSVVADDPETVDVQEDTLTPVEDENMRSQPEPDPVIIAVSIASVVGDRNRLQWRDVSGRLRQSWSDTVIHQADVNELEALEPYGDDLEAVLDDTIITAAELAETLHGMGIWRYEDVTARALRDAFAAFGQRASVAARTRMKAAREPRKT